MKPLVSLALWLAAAATSFAQYPMPQKPLKQYQLENDAWSVTYDSTGVNALVQKKDPYKADIIGGSGKLGSIQLAYKVENGIWLNLSADKREMSRNGNVITYTDKTLGNCLTLEQSFTFGKEDIEWEIRVQNNSKFKISIGDLAFAYPWCGNVDSEDPTEIFEHTFTKHAFISGDASFIYLTKFNGEGPFPLLINKPGTSTEYFSSGRGGYSVYIHSGKTGGREKKGTWRQEHSFGTLQPYAVREYGFTLSSEDSYQAMRNALYEKGSIDSKIVPGMTLPRGHKGSFALRTKCAIDSVVAEYPTLTKLSLRETRGDSEIWDVQFDKLGENMLTVYFDGNRKTYLEFFCCQSPETLLKKRSSFIVNKQQWKVPGKWYDGLYGVYDMSEGELRGPDNPDFYDDKLPYFLASDDPILGKAPFVASKNAVFPDKTEIESLEYYIENFVWGGLQRTDQEKPYPYGVYGTPNWYINRNPDLRATLTDYKTDRLRVWRTYDYPHVVMLWWEMYKIAKRYPEMISVNDAATYLERAYQTAKVYFKYPTELLGEYYETFKWGAYNELIIPEIIDELDGLSRHSQADTLREGWEKKVKYFVYDDPYPYRSEYAADRTAFESTYALADYGMRHDMKPDKNSWFDPNKNVWYSHPQVNKSDVRDFMERQLYANLACRGTLENQWFLLGSDFFNSSDWSTMSYMARMGGWGVLEYGLHYSDAPYDWIRLGYNSYLGQFGLMNAGDAQSDYGYWYPGKDKDGALGQAFTPSKTGSAWIGTEENRRPWRYCGEGDLGMGAITRTSAAILANDPTFGWTLYGGIAVSDDNFSFIPDDGTRNRFDIVSDELKLMASIDRDNWSDKLPVVVDPSLKGVRMTLVNATSTSHTTVLTLEGCAKSRVTLDGKAISPKKDTYGRLTYSLPVSKTEHLLEIRL